MESKEKKNLVFIRLFPNEDINEQLRAVCKKHDIKTAVVLSAIGQLKTAKLGYFKEKDDYSPETYNKSLEILSLTGNICKHDEHILHLHAVLGDENKNTYGGHFIEGQISITAEIALLKTNIDANRRLNKETGLQDLKLE